MRTLTLVTGRLDLQQGTVQGERGAAEHLTPQECALLTYLIDRTGENVTREELLVAVFGYRPGVQSRAVDDAVKRLRTKIEKVPSRPFHLVSVRGIGYRFVPLQPVARPDLLLRLGSRVVDLERLLVRQPDQSTIALSDQEGRLLAMLWASAGRPVSAADLLREVWGIRDKSQKRVVDKALYRLRAKLGEGKDPQHLVTVRGKGVLLKAVRQTEAAAPPLPGSPVPPLTDPIFGRGALVEEALRLLRPGAILTLHGPAGVGKSTLAAAVASQWTGPSRLAKLAGCLREERVEDALSVALGLSEDADGVRRRLSLSLQQSEGMLLLLDDAEASADVLVSMLGALSGALSGVAVLITSRRPLLCAGEQVLPVGPLALPDARALFLARAQASGVTVDPEDSDLDRLLQGVDQIPLVLELAAGRLRLLGVSGLVARLDQPLRVFRTRDGRGRHGSLRAALSWSWGALSPGVRELLAGITVFGGPFSLEAAEAVMPDPLSTLDGLEELVDVALLRRLPDGRLAPYHGVSELIEEELGEHLRPMLARLRPRLLAWLADLFGDPKLGCPPEPEDYPRLSPALDIALSALDASSAPPIQRARILNWVLPMLLRRERFARLNPLARQLPTPEELPPGLNAVLRRHRALLHPGSRAVGLLAQAKLAREAGEQANEGLLLGMALAGLVEAGHPEHEAVRDRVTSLLPDLAAHPRAEQWVRNGLGWMAFRRGDYDAAWENLQEALIISQRLRAHWARSLFAFHLAGLCRTEGRLAEAEAFIHLSSQAISATENTSAHRDNEDTLGLICIDQGRLDEAAALHRRTHEFDRQTGNRRRAAIQANRLGTIMGLRGHNAEATRWFEQARLGFEGEGILPRVAGARYNLGYLAWLSGHSDEARRQYTAALALFEQLDRRIHQGIVRAALGRLDIETDPDVAVASLRGALALLEEGRFQKRTAEAKALLAFALASTAPDEARGLVTDALQTMTAVSSGPILASVQVISARTWLRLGDRGAAVRLRSEAAALCEALSIRPTSDTGQELARLDAEL